MKSTAIAPSNIAFIKYWGKKDENLRLPANGSISMNLDNMTTATTVEFSPEFANDRVFINETEAGEEKKKRVVAQLDRIRNQAGIFLKAKIVSRNNFPISSGLSSSASGFAALTLAAADALGLDLDTKKLSILSRFASGSAARSIPDGFVEWFEGNDSDSSYAESIFAPDFWDIQDIVVVVGSGEKKTATTEGQRYAATSPFFEIRLKHLDDKITKIKKFISERDFTSFGELIEAEALEFHSIIITSTPGLIYWLPETLHIMHTARNLRQDGIPVYFTINTGHDVHLICRKKDTQKIKGYLEKEKVIKKIIINSPSYGARITGKHLF